MTEASQLRVGAARLDEMRADAEHAQRRYQLYKARSYGPRASSPVRLRELKRESERAASALKRASTDV